MLDKKAQIADTITWVVATIIIILILGSSIFALSLFDFLNKKTLTFKENSDLLATESFLAYLQTKDSSQKSVYEQLKSDGNLNEFNGKLAQNIFKELYTKDYPPLLSYSYGSIWLGIYDGWPSLYNFNFYFLGRPSVIHKKPWTNILPVYLPFLQYEILPHNLKRIKLDENKYIDLLLRKNE